MNREQRRRMAKSKQFRGQKVIVGGDDIKTDPKKANFCTRHNLKLDDIDDPTDRDRRLIESVRLVPYKIIDKDGMIVRGKKCPRCFQMIEISKEAPTQPRL